MKLWAWEDWTAIFKGQNQVPERAVSAVCFAVIDSETTGLDPVKDRILSVGGVKIIGGRIAVQDTLEIFIAQDHFDASSVPIHGILKTGPNARIPEKQALVQLGTYLEDTIVVGHHIGFDLEMIRQAQRRQGLPPLTNLTLDTGRLYRKTLLKTPLVPKKPSYSLDELAEKFDISCKDRHTALGDAYITALAFLHILGQLNIKSETSLKELLRMGR
ncbi:MAG: 3'-5' exonuclease [Robiginitalea sp.]|uniref:3'-5' exonuclease n=1 Tax=Robiginitalea sp. TaxID=1902411 RepID=UPI003C746DA7